MSFSSFKNLTGAAIVLAACLSAGPSLARPISQQLGDALIAQENVPPREGTPQLNREAPLAPDDGSGTPRLNDGSQMTEEVRGKVTRISGNQVEVQTSSGVRTYEISEADQERNNIDVGSDVVLTVRGDSVVAISPAGVQRSGSSSSSTTTSGSSSTVRRETTVQQTRPAPRPAPAPAPARPAPAPEPVRGLW
jgi:hypothetical protein